MAWWLLGGESANERRIRLLEEKLGVNNGIDVGDDPVSLEPKAVRGEDPERAAYENSPTPWVKLVGEDVADGQIKISLDWNSAFIKTLKENGYEGVDDNQRVQKWLAQTAMNIAADLGQKFFEGILQEPEVDIPVGPENQTLREMDT